MQEFEGFSGTAHTNLDDKGRISLSARHRQMLQAITPGVETVQVTLSYKAPYGDVERCIHIYPLPEFAAIRMKLRAAPSTDPVVAAAKWQVLGNAVECTIDKQGRLLIPAPLREQIGLGEAVTVQGGDNVLEVWSRSDWESTRKNVGSALAGGQKNLADRGI